MNKSILAPRAVWLALLSLIALIGCTPVEETPPPSPTATATGTPATPTGSPTAGATGKKAPAAEQVMEHLKKAGLPIGRTDVYNVDNDPHRLLGRPDSYIGKTVFHDTRYPLKPNAQDQLIEWQNWGGTLEIYEEEADIELAKKKIKAQQERIGSLPPEYQFVKGLVFLRLGHVLTPAQAKEYEAALNSFQTA